MFRRLLILSATVPICFPLRSTQSNCQSPVAPLAKTSRPSPEAEASMCQVLMSLATPFATLCGSPLSFPVSGSKGCAINWSPRANRR